MSETVESASPPPPPLPLTAEQKDSTPELVLELKLEPETEKESESKLTMSTQESKATMAMHEGKPTIETQESKLTTETTPAEKTALQEGKATTETSPAEKTAVQVPKFSWLKPHATFVILLVGPDEQPFGMQKDFLCYRCGFYRRYFAERQREGERLEHIVKLPDTSVQVFGLAQNYLFTGDVIAAAAAAEDSGGGGGGVGGRGGGRVAMPSYEALVNLWNLGYRLEVDGLCERALDAMTECRRRTARIPSTPLLVQVWKQAPAGAAIRRLLLAWTAEYMRSSAARTEFAKSLPQEVLSELVVTMSKSSVPSLSCNGLGNGMAGTGTGTGTGAAAARSRNVHYLEGADDDVAAVGAKRSRRVSALPGQMVAGPMARVDGTAAAAMAAAGAGAKSRVLGPKLHKRRSGQAMDERLFSTASKLDFCADLLARMLSGPGFWTRLVGPFREPVEPDEDGVPDYLDKVKRPMDLMTIKGKMDGKGYRDEGEFAADVRQIFSNCFTYWKPGQPMYEAGERLQRTFEDKYSHMNKWIAKMSSEDGE